jgi:hypothetical protein
MTTPQQPEFRFQVPDDLASGVYANIVGVWHTPFEFTLDFAVMQPPEEAVDSDGTARVVIPSRVVARVKLPPAQVFDLMQALSTNERIYEDRLGQIQRPGRTQGEPPMFPPDS